MGHTGSAAWPKNQVMVSRHRLGWPVGWSILAGARRNAPRNFLASNPAIAPKRPVDDGAENSREMLLDGRAFQEPQGQRDGLEGGQAIPEVGVAQTVVRLLGCGQADGLNPAQAGYAPSHAVCMPPGSVGDDQGDGLRLHGLGCQ